MAIRTAAIAAIGTLAFAGTTLVPATTAATTTPDTGERNAKNVAIQPGALDRGHRPRTLYRKGRRIHDGRQSFKIRGPKGLQLVGKGDGGYLMVRYGQYHGNLWQIRPHRKARRLGTVSQAGYNGGDQYMVSDAGNRVVITEPTRSGFMMWVRALPSGKQIRFRFMGNWARPVAFPKYRVLFTKSHSTFWYAPRKNKRIDVADAQGYVASRDENRLIVRSETGADR
ncbi:MAG: hypothetical protein L0K86_05330, partial [Actinomycetia bacterium]|nr:hypothetical protein [Actinomycetes bacterium]